jgi:hypothetical protein
MTLAILRGALARLVPRRSDTIVWHALAEEQPDNAQFVVATDGVTRWLDRYYVAAGSMTSEAGSNPLARCSRSARGQE